MDTRSIPGAFAPGRQVRCVDATNEAWFLYPGHVYTIQTTQRDDSGRLRLNLLGMARAWEVERFEAV